MFSFFNIFLLLTYSVVRLVRLLKISWGRSSTSLLDRSLKVSRKNELTFQKENNSSRNVTPIKSETIREDTLTSILSLRFIGTCSMLCSCYMAEVHYAATDSFHALYSSKEHDGRKTWSIDGTQDYRGTPTGQNPRPANFYAISFP